MLSFLKENLLPGSLRLLIFGLLAGLVLMRLPGVWGRWGRRLLVTMALTYSLMSLPVVSIVLTAPLQSLWIPATDVAMSQASAIVVLGGGVATYRGPRYVFELPGDETTRRVIHAAHLAGQLATAQVILSGGVITDRQHRSEAVAMRDLIVRLGVPADRVRTEERSRNTHEQAIQIHETLTELGVKHFLLVTSELHMYRAVAAFRTVGRDPQPAASPCCRWSGASAGLWALLPSDEALRISSFAFYEYFGLAYYRAKGWI